MFFAWCSSSSKDLYEPEMAKLPDQTPPLEPKIEEVQSKPDGKASSTGSNSSDSSDCPANDPEMIRIDTFSKKKNVLTPIEAVGSTKKEHLFTEELSRPMKYDPSLTKDQAKIVESNIQELESGIQEAQLEIRDIKMAMKQRKLQWITEKSKKRYENALMVVFGEEDVVELIISFNFMASRQMRWTILRDLSSAKSKVEFKKKALQSALANWKNHPKKELLYLHMRKPL